MQTILAVLYYYTAT